MQQKLKRTLCLALAILMLCGSIPVSTFAEMPALDASPVSETASQSADSDSIGTQPVTEETPPAADTSVPAPDVSEPPPPASTPDVPSSSASMPRASESVPSTSEGLPPDSTGPPDSSQPSESESNSAASSTPPQSEVPDTDTSMPEQDSDKEFTPLEITEMSTTFAGVPGDVVDFFVKLNRDDVAVEYQWQRLNCGESYDGTGEAVYDYAEGEDTRYVFTLDGMTEAEILEMNPDATWPGIEMYLDQVEKAKKSGGDASEVHIEQNTPNYVLNSEAAAMQDGTGTLDPGTADTSAWKDIDGATESVYRHTVTAEDANCFYRCRITIVDAEYLAANDAAQAEPKGNSEQAEISSEAAPQAAPQAAMLMQEPQDETTEEASGNSAAESATPLAPTDAAQETDEQTAVSFLTDNMFVELPEDDAEAPPQSRARNATTFAAGEPQLSFDKQWIENIGSTMEYITADTYLQQNASAANNEYWTKLSGGVRPDGTKYAAMTLVGNNKTHVLSAWYGKTIYVRPQGNAGTGTTIEIPAYTGQEYQTGRNFLYKNAVRVLNVYIPDTGVSFYGGYLKFISDAEGFLKDSGNRQLPGIPQITVNKVPIDSFNRTPQSYLTDAEGNYKFDLVIVGACTNAEPDISGAAAWALRDYIDEGYGFLIGHDTMYGYGGVTNADYVPDKNSNTTPYYVADTKINGHWNMNWLMGANKHYTQANPYEAPSMILNTGDYSDKSTLYGDAQGQSVLRVTKTMEGSAISNVGIRCPTNYPYSKRDDNVGFDKNSLVIGTATHTNQQMAYGTVWLDYASDTISSIGCGRLVTDTRNGLSGTNNFYLATNGNFGMNQIGHVKDNINSARINEIYILANTIMYLSQRQQCQVCQSEQGGNKDINFVRRISSLEQLEMLRTSTSWYNYPKDGCYMLAANLALPADWEPIEGFSGHFHADNKTVEAPDGISLFAQDGTLGQHTNAESRGWNLGEDKATGLDSVSFTNSAGQNKRTTGIARVSGYLHELFGTKNGNAYAGGRVEITGTDGKTYSGKVNSDGKYVISNLPCTGVMVAHVYGANGDEITSYGRIRVNVPENFWETCETTPLYLLGFNALPCEDKTVYEAMDTAFVEGGVVYPSPVQSVQWQYKTNATGEWKNIETAPFSHEIGAPVFHDLGDDSYTTVSLKLKNCTVGMDGYHVQALITANGKTVKTADASTENKTGRLNVNPRPAYLTQAQDKTVWAGKPVSYTSTMEYWRGTADGVTVKWQYRDNASTAWQDVTAAKFPGFTQEETTGAGIKYPEIAPVKTTTTLNLPAVSKYWTQYHFRAMYSYNIGGETRTWVSSDVDKAGYTGLLVVLQPDVKVTNPDDQTVNLTLGQSGSSETATYTSVVTYKPDNEVPTIAWKYNTLSDFTPRVWNQSVASALYPGSGIEVNITNSAPKPVEGDADAYEITSTMTIKNAPIAMDYNAVKYRFQCTAENTMDNKAASSFALLNVLYPIDIKHNQSVTTINGDGSTTFTYPELQVVAPDIVKLRTLILQFSSPVVDGRDAISYSNLPQGTTVNGDQYALTFHNNEGLTAQQWQDWLRSYTSWRVFEPNVQAYWYIDQDATSSSVYFNSSNGHYYELMTFSYEASLPDARNIAHTRNYLGLTGYLATITSPSENTAIVRLMKSAGGAGGIGGTSTPAYGSRDWHQWTWVDGPENGFEFTHQPTFAPYNNVGRDLPYAINGAYTNWIGWEPYYGDSGGPNNNTLRYNPDGTWALGGTGYTAWVVEYGGYPGQGITRTTHSAWDIDNIGTSGAVITADAALSAESVTYDGKPHGASFTLSGAGLSAAMQNEIRAGATLNYLYPNGTWSTTTPVDVAAYGAKLTFNAGIAAKYSLTEKSCDFEIFPRKLNVTSTGNNKVYDDTRTASIQNAVFEPFNAAAGTGVVAGDAVSLGFPVFAGQYPDLHQTNNKQVSITRTQPLPLTGAKAHNYTLGIETYTGAITPRGLAVHSLYLEDENNPRNIKRYDGTTNAVISDVLVDNIVQGDNVALNATTWKGVYADKNSGETLKPDGTVQDDRDKKMTENPITRTASISLINNEHGDYHIASEQYSGAISREILGVRVQGMTFTYGTGMQSPPRYTSKYSNTVSGASTNLVISKLVPGDTLTIDPAKTQFVYDPITKTTPVGMYPLEITGITEANYPILTNYILWRQPGYLDVTPRALRITVNGGYEKFYGDTNPAFSVKYEYGVPDAWTLEGDAMYQPGFGPSGDTAETALEGTLTFTTPCNWQSDVIWASNNRDHLPYPVYASGLTPKRNANGRKNYEIEWVSGTVTVHPVEVTVTGVSCVKTYGNNEPELKYVLSRPRVKPGDIPYGQATRIQGEDVGVYQLLMNHFYDPNYKIKQGPPAYLEIVPALLMVNATGGTKVYGEENPPLTTNYSGFRRGDTEFSAMDGTAVPYTRADRKATVGNYSVWPVGMSVKKNINGLYNYELVENGAYIIVTKRPVDVYADNLTKLIGTQDPALTFHLGEGQFVVDPYYPIEMSLVRTPGEALGQYPIYANPEENELGHEVDCTCRLQWTNWNYDVTYHHGMLTIKEQDKLVATVQPSEKIYGEENPAQYTLRYTLNGNPVAPEDVAALGITGTPVFTTGCTQKSMVDEYAVSVSGITSTACADFTFVPGTLTVKPRPMMVQPNYAEKKYGEADPVFTYALVDAITGQVYQDGTDPAARINPGDLAGNIGRVSGENKGLYAYTLGTLADDPNYVLTSAPVNFQIRIIKVRLMMEEVYTKYVGEENPEFTATFTGLANGDTPESMSEHLIFETDCTKDSPVGDYTVTPYFSEFGVKEENYSFTFITTFLRVIERPAQ